MIRRDSFHVWRLLLMTNMPWSHRVKCAARSMKIFHRRWSCLRWRDAVFVRVYIFSLSFVGKRAKWALSSSIATPAHVDIVLRYLMGYGHVREGRHGSNPYIMIEIYMLTSCMETHVHIVICTQRVVLMALRMMTIGQGQIGFYGDCSLGLARRRCFDFHIQRIV